MEFGVRNVIALHWIVWIGSRNVYEKKALTYSHEKVVKQGLKVPTEKYIRIILDYDNLQFN